MTSGLIRQALRLWATIIVAWALILSGMLPSLSSDMASSSHGVICSTADASGGSNSGGSADHGKLCCIVCGAGSMIAVPAPAETAATMPLPAGNVVPVGGRPLVALPRAPPEAWPLNPRAPPIDA